MGAAIGTLTLLGLYVVYVLAGFLSLFLAVGSISSDIESGTLHAVLARPLRRSEYILGRWLAYVALITVYVVAMVGLILLVARIIAGFEVPEPVPATGFLLLSAILLLTLSLFGSTIFPTLANGVIVFSLLGLAWLGGVIEAVARVLNNATMLNLATLVSLLLPSDGLWRAASYYLQPPSILAISAAARGANPFVGYLPPTTPYIIWAGLYPLVFLLLAVFTFSRRDL